MEKILLLASLVANALMAGLYWGFSVAVMPGLRQADDHTFVTAMQWINRRITNPLFFLAFFGALLLPIGASVVTGDKWAMATAALYFLAFLSTVAVNVPLNNELDKVGDRQRFERKWTTWNHVRALLCTAAVVTNGLALL